MGIEPVFGFQMPKALPNVPEGILNPRNAWVDKAAYDAEREKLAGMFIDNYKNYIIPGVTDYSPFGPKLQHQFSQGAANPPAFAQPSWREKFLEAVRTLPKPRFCV